MRRYLYTVIIIIHLYGEKMETSEENIIAAARHHLLASNALLCMHIVQCALYIMNIYESNLYFN